MTNSFNYFHSCYETGYNYGLIYYPSIDYTIPNTLIYGGVKQGDCSHFMRIDTSKKYIDIPMFLYREISTLINNDITDILCPLGVFNVITCCKTTPAALKNWSVKAMKDIVGRDAFPKLSIVDIKGVRYYGNPWMILNSDMVPLFINYIRVLVPEMGYRLGSVVDVVPKQFITKFNFNILNRESGLVEKHLFKYFLKYLQDINNKINFVEDFGLRRSLNDFPIEVKFSNLEDAIIKPVIPKVSNSSNETFKNILLNHFDQL